MEVTRKNFKETLPLVEESINKAHFLVIDAEFTGLINGRDVSMFDTPAEYYSRLLYGSSEFLLIQYGLCAFYWDEEKNHYINDAYNFYVYPRGRPGLDKMFLCQSSSLEFLASQGFDFNKLIRDGIPYMTEPAEKRLRENLTERHKSYSVDKDKITIPEENKQQIAEICEKVRKFIDDKDCDDIEIDRCNAFIRRLLFQELGAKFKDEVFLETKILENKSRVLKVSRVKNPADTKSKECLRKEKEWEEFEDAIGFSKVARMISQSEKLVIGHNMLLDVLHTLNHFFHPLPNEYESFKEFTHCMFPRLLDTKYMTSLPPFKDKVNSSVLQHLYSTLSEEPFKMPRVESASGRGYLASSEKHHEAGYDAFVTGLCFLAMYAHLSRAPVPDPDSAVLRPYLNKLFLARTAHQDSPYMNMSGRDANPSRDHVFHMTFPKEWVRNDINQLFSPFGPVTVQFLDDTSAVVALSRREQARDVMRALSHHGRAKLIPYTAYRNTMAQVQGPEQASPTTEVSVVTSKTQIVAKTVTSPAEESSQKSPGTRRRSSSVTSPATHGGTRKRTSSGVFQVDEAEPPQKKPELSRSNSDCAGKTKVVVNGRGKSAESSRDKAKQKEKEVKKAVVEKFDSESSGNTVTAFKESDSWD